LARRRVAHGRRGRITYEKGRMVVIPRYQNVYLGREVKDVGKKGLDKLSEVRGILKQLDEDAKHGVSLRTINARTRILWLAVLRDEDFSKEERRKAVRMINEFRRKYGWKPLKPKKPLS